MRSENPLWNSPRAAGEGGFLIIGGEVVKPLHEIATFRQLLAETDERIKKAGALRTGFGKP